MNIDKYMWLFIITIACGTTIVMVTLLKLYCGKNVTLFSKITAVISFIVVGILYFFLENYYRSMGYTWIESRRKVVELIFYINLPIALVGYISIKLHLYKMNSHSDEED